MRALAGNIVRFQAPPAASSAGRNTGDPASGTPRSERSRSPSRSASPDASRHQDRADRGSQATESVHSREGSYHTLDTDRSTGYFREFMNRRVHACTKQT